MIKAKVTRKAVINASSIAGMFITSEATVISIKEDKEDNTSNMSQGMY